MPDLVIVGAGGFGAETASLVEDINRAGGDWDLLGFLDDDTSLRGDSILGYEILGGSDWLADRDVQYVVAVGGSRTRRDLVAKIQPSGATPATLVHPTVAIHPTSVVGPGSIVCRGVTITVRATLGSHCIVNLHCTIGHDAGLSDYATLHPGVHLSGASQVGEATEVGTGAVLLPGVRIGSGSLIGAGAVVTRDLPPAVVATGVPARPTRELEPL